MMCGRYVSLIAFQSAFCSRWHQIRSTHWSNRSSWYSKDDIKCIYLRDDSPMPLTANAPRNATQHDATRISVKWTARMQVKSWRIRNITLERLIPRACQLAIWNKWITSTACVVDLCSSTSYCISMCVCAFHIPMKSFPRDFRKYVWTKIYWQAKMTDSQLWDFNRIALNLSRFWTSQIC